MKSPFKPNSAKTERLSALPKAFGDVLFDFSVYLRMELGRGKNTVDSYLSDVLQFCEFALENGKRSFEEVDVDTLSNWVCDVAKFSKTTTQSRKISALRTLADFLIDEDLWDKNLSERIARPKVVRAVPEVLEASQIDNIISAPTDDSPEAFRDRAMLELVYSSGLRVSELCNLKESDIDAHERIIRVVGKGNKTRLVPVGDLALQAIAEYKLRRPELAKKSTVAELFITRRGKKISRKTFWYNLKKYAEKAGVSGSVKPHGLRHCFATHLLRNGANLFSIKEMLGHSDLSTTQIYTQLVRDDIISEYNAKHPRSKMDVETDV
jgi:integrase/recombinase XerD